MFRKIADLIFSIANVCRMRIGGTYQVGARGFCRVVSEAYNKQLKS